MDLLNFFPIWKQLSKSEQERLSHVSQKRTIPKGTMIHNGSSDCVGLLLLDEGQLRVFISSEEGREVTLYRLFEHDICLFSASCMMPSIQFDVFIETEKDTVLWVIPPKVYHEMMDKSAVLANYTNQIMASRLSEIMWLIEQVMWKSFDKRLAAFLLEETIIENSLILKITHEKIANHLGTAREVVTRMLKYFQTENLITLSRGTIEITDMRELQKYI